MLRIVTAEGQAQFENLRDEWSALVVQCSSATPFQTWEWHCTWFKHFGFGSTPFFLLAYSGPTLVGLFPLVEKRGIFGSCFTSMGVGPSDYLQPLLASGYEPEITVAFNDFLSNLQTKSQVDLHQIRSGPTCLGFKANQDWSQATCLVLELPECFDAYLGELGKSLRADILKGMKLGDSYKFEESNASNVSAYFGMFLTLHRQRWRRRGLPGAFVGRTLRFHREWVQIAANNGWVSLTVLKHEGEPIGALYTMRYKDTDYFYQLGIKSDIKGISPGTILVARAIRRAIGDQKMFFDFMRGDEPYKHRWKPNSSYVNHRLVYRRVGIVGAASFKWTEFIWRVECAIRARVEGRGLL